MTETTEQKQGTIYKWTNGVLTATPDPRELGWSENGESYEKAMLDLGYTRTKMIVGQPDYEVFGYELFEHKSDEKWFVELVLNGGCYQILVAGLPDLLSFMHHFAPIVLSTKMDDE
jgi:hypothetical protein